MAGNDRGGSNENTPNVEHAKEIVEIAGGKKPMSDAEVRAWARTKRNEAKFGENTPSAPPLMEPMGEAHQIFAKEGSIALGVLLAYVCASRLAWGWTPILDSATLAIHEGGHPIFGMLSGRLMVYGGSILQIIFPLGICAHFWRRRHALGWSFAAIWEGSSLCNLGRYVADARAMDLPLVGSGDRIHDWNYILDSWGILGADKAIGGIFALCGWGIFAYAGWALWWIWRRANNKIKGSGDTKGA